MERTYLDNAATTPIAPEVVDAMLPYLREHFGNPSSIHAHGRRTRAAVEQARRTIAGLLNCSPGEIIFTSSGTEADNMALRCAVRDLNATHVISSPTEHHAIEHTYQEIDRQGQARVHLVRLDAEGRADLDHLEDLLRQHPRALISLMHANNEIGTRNDIKAIGELGRTHGAVLHSDTVQTMGHYRFDLQQLPVDMLTASAHKFHGPKGVGFLYLRSGLTLRPLIQGGAQERNMRGGTENVIGIVGLAKAMELAYADLEAHQQHVRGLKQHMMDRLRAEVPDVGFNGDVGPDSLYTVLNVRFPDDGRAEMLIYNLDIEGISVSGGSACSSGSNTGSHVLGALYGDRPGANIRFSFSRYNTMAEVDRTVDVLLQVLGIREGIPVRNV
ncbi:MAG: cysteine desulfurase [Flavobacteriales bacterium]|nr:cysteine desulfurase [Flavobacteriales bacterium]